MKKIPLSDSVLSVTALAGMVGVLVVLSGCSVVDDLAYGRAEATYTNAQDLAQARGEAPAWLPGDARQIQRVSSTRSEEDESLVFQSEEGLAGCTETERLSAPTMEVESGVDIYSIDRIALCGDWAVAAQDGTYYAWTPASESGESTP